MEKKIADGLTEVDIPDAILMAGIIWPDFITDSVECGTLCITDEGPTYGEVLFYEADYNYESYVKVDNYNKILVENINDAAYLNMIKTLLKDE